MNERPAVGVMSDSMAALVRTVRERLFLGFVFGLLAEVAWQGLMYAGVLKAPHGFMLVMFWCIYSSNAYGARYERSDALRPVLAIGLLFAVLFALAMRLVLLANAIERPAVTYSVFAFSLMLGWLSSAVQWRRSRRR